MESTQKPQDQGMKKEKKGFWKGLIEKLDRSMVEKANQSPCCGPKSKDGKCC